MKLIICKESENRYYGYIGQLVIQVCSISRIEDNDNKDLFRLSLMDWFSIAMAGTFDECVEYITGVLKGEITPYIDYDGKEYGEYCATMYDIIKEIEI